jgi:hypothetical protein
MRIGICTIQRNRGKWLKEWVAFHHVVGITHFYIYLHKCTDDSKEVVTQLQKNFNIQCFEVNEDTVRPQLVAYQHAYENFGYEIDWMAFIDGDEFLFPSAANTLSDVLQDYQYQKLSALGVYWQCFGSSGHVQDPNGLIIEDYIYRANLDFLANRHIKSIVKGSQGSHCTSAGNAHLFNTIYGTCDELMRPIHKGLMDELIPSYQKIRINHYVCQSMEYFKNFKQNSGSADAGAKSVRSDEWWNNHNRNDEVNQDILKYSTSLKKVFSQII